MFAVDPSLQEILVKPAAAAAVAAGIDRMYFQNKQLSGNIAFGSAVALGLLAADLTSKYAIPAPAVTKSIEARALEIGAGSALALITDHYLFEKDRSYEIPQRLLAVAASEVAGEYIAGTFYQFR